MTATLSRVLRLPGPGLTTLAMAALGLLALTACAPGPGGGSAGSAGSAGPSGSMITTSAATSSGGSPTASGSASASMSVSRDPASATPSRLVPAPRESSGVMLEPGTRAYAVTSLVWSGDPVPTPGWETAMIETDAPFRLAVTELCGQPHVDVAPVSPGAWDARPSDGQPAIACLPEAPTAKATEAVRQLFDGRVDVATDDDGTLTLSRAGVELRLSPAVLAPAR